MDMGYCFRLIWISRRGSIRRLYLHPGIRSVSLIDLGLTFFEKKNSINVFLRQRESPQEGYFRVFQYFVALPSMQMCWPVIYEPHGNIDAASDNFGCFPNTSRRWFTLHFFIYYPSWNRRDFSCKVTKIHYLNFTSKYK